MGFTTKTRYGAMESYSDDLDIPAVVESLIQELETEKFDEPDDEHFQVAIGYGDWAITVTVYGLMILDDMRELENGRVVELFKRAASREEAIALLTMMAKGQIAEVQAAGWLLRDQVAPYKRDLFRKATVVKKRKKGRL
jgi:hypothetical protein